MKKIDWISPISTIARFLSGAFAFGYWQHSYQAGIFAFFLLVTIEEK